MRIAERQKSLLVAGAGAACRPMSPELYLFEFAKLLAVSPYPGAGGAGGGSGDSAALHALFGPGTRPCFHDITTAYAGNCSFVKALGFWPKYANCSAGEMV
jgi:hypothetical protein